MVIDEVDKSVPRPNGRLNRLLRWDFRLGHHQEQVASPAAAEVVLSHVTS
jgi:hypothetical protein